MRAQRQVPRQAHGAPLRRTCCQPIPSLRAFLDNWDLVRMDWPNDWQYGGWNYVEGIRLSGCGFLNNMTAMTENIGPGTGRMGSQGWAPYSLVLNACVEDGTSSRSSRSPTFVLPRAAATLAIRTAQTAARQEHLLRRFARTSCYRRPKQASFSFRSNVDWFSPSPYQLSIGEVECDVPLDAEESLLKCCRMRNGRYL